ncbi:pantoate kinase [Methanosphaera sp. ISO3-F5]|uniref:pantoate kinase n=1 Tax=Methanosphaera sp. ISO3-F5 TaxID=1452353 RepID=UPI002B25B90B|nr:pantoate kinase [Methanosphaera sp. ISO3-F5]WQH64531.1 pantoate kinase [Methanosphaera sp. ISO3-F5]
MIDRLKVFVPAHITGFFEIFQNTDPVLKGSRGAGIALDEGVVTETVVEDGCDRVVITINGKENALNTISRRAVEIIRERYSPDLSNVDIHINHETSLPISAGFGTSAGFALGVSFTLPRLLGINLSFNEAGEIAHLTELSESSGLGDVISEMHGGCVLRLLEGSPVRARIDKILPDKTVYVISKTLSSINTRDVIEDPVQVNMINSNGHELLNMLRSNPCIENFIALSRKFSVETKLVNPELNELLDIFDDETIGSSMAMLGNTAFALSYTPDVSIEDCLITKINRTGIKYLKKI